MIIVATQASAAKSAAVTNFYSFVFIHVTVYNKIDRITI